MRGGSPLAVVSLDGREFFEGEVGCPVSGDDLGVATEDPAILGHARDRCPTHPDMSGNCVPLRHLDELLGFDHGHGPQDFITIWKIEVSERPLGPHRERNLHVRTVRVVLVWTELDEYRFGLHQLETEVRSVLGEFVQNARA